MQCAFASALEESNVHALALFRVLVMHSLGPQLVATRLFETRPWAFVYPRVTLTLSVSRRHLPPLLLLCSRLMSLFMYTVLAGR